MRVAFFCRVRSVWGGGVWLFASLVSVALSNVEAYRVVSWLLLNGFCAVACIYTKARSDTYHFSFCGQRWIRTTEVERQQIYSLPHLATLEFAQTASLSKGTAKVLLFFEIASVLQLFFTTVMIKCRTTGRNPPF